MNYPRLNEIPRQRLWTEQFMGLDRRPRTYDGTFEAMGNMTGDPWPLLSSRKKRGLVAELQNPQAMAALGKLAWIDGAALYFDGQPTAINDLSLAADMTPKRIVTMGAYLIILPDKRYYNTVNPEDRGSIERLWASAGNVTYTLCDMDGNDYPANHMHVSDTDPLDGTPEPEEGDYWLNTSQKPHTLSKLYDGEWIGVSSLYVKISAPGIGAGLKAQDGVQISGIAYSGDNDSLKEQLETLNAGNIAAAVDDDFIVVAGIIDETYTQTAGTVRADRRMPALDYVVECNNRLWGCRYGQQDGEMVNTIYACALGDFKNWEKFMGTAMDSYYVQVGTDGPFTGAAVHRGSPYFFKAHCVHKVYGEKPSNFQTILTECDGVRPGCADTLAAHNGILYYVGTNSVNMFESLPEPIGQALGGKVLEGTAGKAGPVYYLSARDESGDWSLYAFDTERRLWHRQDDSRALAFAEMDGEAYMLLANGLLYSLSGAAGEPEAGDVTWFAETAEMGYEYPDHKYLSRFLLRLKMDETATCSVSIQYDSSGIWEPKGSIQGQGRVKIFLLPIVPRRCEHLKLRMEGHGTMSLYGIARELAMGK